MEIRIQTEVSPIKGGWLARTPKLRLARAGKSESEALERLKHSVSAYCAGLSREGILAEALRRHGVTTSGSDATKWEVVADRLAPGGSPAMTPQDAMLQAVLERLRELLRHVAADPQAELVLREHAVTAWDLLAGDGKLGSAFEVGALERLEEEHSYQSCNARLKVGDERCDIHAFLVAATKALDIELGPSP